MLLEDCYLDETKTEFESGQVECSAPTDFSGKYSNNIRIYLQGGP